MQDQRFSPESNEGLQFWQMYNYLNGGVMTTWSPEMVTLPGTGPVEKENRPLKPICLTPILPRAHNTWQGPVVTSPDSLPGKPLQTSTPIQPDRSRSRIPAFQSQLPVSSELSAFRSCKPLQTADAIPPTNSANLNDDRPETRPISHDSEATASTKSVSPISYRSSPTLSPSSDTSPRSGYGSSSSRQTSSLNNSEERTCRESGYWSKTSSEQQGQEVKKKGRATYKPEQLVVLERQFQENPYPDAERLEILSRDIGIPETKLKIWFQNKRARWRRRRDNRIGAYSYVTPPTPALPAIMPTYRLMASSPELMPAADMMQPGTTAWTTPYVAPPHNLPAVTQTSSTHIIQPTCMTASSQVQRIPGTIENRTKMIFKPYLDSYYG